MRTFAILASLVVFCTAFSTADSITITTGHGVLDNSGAAGPTYHFGFSGSGKGITVPFPQDDWEGQRSLVECNQCDPRCVTPRQCVYFGLHGLSSSVLCV